MMKLKQISYHTMDIVWNIRYSIDEMERAFISGEILFEVESPIACECGG